MEIIFALIPLLFMLIWAVMFLLILGSIILWVIMLIDCISRDDNNFPNPGQNTKLIWILVLIFAGAVGAIIYYFQVKKATPNKLAPK